jgi:putative flavoprotein involved in K+ transport
MATGYRPALHDLLPAMARVTDASGTPLVSGCESPLRGLFFCEFHVALTRMLREIGIEAQRIARAIGAGRHTPV